MAPPFGELSNYPPGVTGHEYQIQGADSERETDEPCPKCGVNLGEESYDGETRLWCPECDYLGEWVESEPYDHADDIRDRMEDR